MTKLFLIRIFKLMYDQIRIENDVGKKLHLLRTGCVTGVTRILITLFIFINWPNRNIRQDAKQINLLFRF